MPFSMDIEYPRLGHTWQFSLLFMRQMEPHPCHSQSKCQSEQKDVVEDTKALQSNPSKLRNPRGMLLRCLFRHSIRNALEFQLKVTTGKYNVLFSTISFRKQEQKKAFSPCLNHKIFFWLPKSSLKTSSKTWENWRGNWKVIGTVLL